MFEKSAGAAVFYKRGTKTEYLLLHYQAGHWDFPKGHVEKNERTEETVRREVLEETGLKDIKIFDGFKTWVKYFYRSYQDPKKFNFKIVDFCLARSKTKKVTISREHIGYEWLPYERALERLTFKNAKEVLKKVHAFLQKIY